MKLTTKTRYGVRAMFDIAYHTAEPGDPAVRQECATVQAKDIARREGIPLRYLEQIFQDLKRAGLVESKRGPRGGYTLKCDPSRVSIGDLVVALQGPIEDMFVLAGDASDSSPCSREVTAGVWRDLSEHVTQWLGDLTLADLVGRASKLGVPRRAADQPTYFI